MNMCLLHNQSELTLLTDCWLHTQSESNLVEPQAKQQFLTHFLQLTGKKSILGHLWHAGEACLIFCFFLPGSICIISTLPSAFGLVRRCAMVDPGIGFWLMEGNSCCPPHNERRQRCGRLNSRDNHSLIQTVMQNLYWPLRRKACCQAAIVETHPPPPPNCKVELARFEIFHKSEQENQINTSATPNADCIRQQKCLPPERDRILETMAVR